MPFYAYRIGHSRCNICKKYDKYINYTVCWLNVLIVRKREFKNFLMDVNDFNVIIEKLYIHKLTNALYPIYRTNKM